MDPLTTINTLRILQAADEITARLAGEFSSVHGISVNEFMMLMHLAQAGEQRLSRVELARRMHVAASTVTRMAAPMEKIGLIARQADARDARLAFVVLTDAGREKLGEARATLDKRAEGFFRDRWSEAEMQTFADMLYRLVSGAAGNLT